MAPSVVVVSPSGQEKHSVLFSTGLNVPVMTFIKDFPVGRYLCNIHTMCRSLISTSQVMSVSRGTIVYERSQTPFR